MPPFYRDIRLFFLGFALFISSCRVVEVLNHNAFDACFFDTNFPQNLGGFLGRRIWVYGRNKQIS